MAQLPYWMRPRRLIKNAQDIAMATGIMPSHDDYQKFIILGRGRSGSNFLATSLSSHPAVVCFGEIFNNNARDVGTINFQYPGYHGKDKKLVEQRDNRPLEFLDRTILGKHPARVKAVGFKLFYFHAQEADWLPVWDYLQEQNFRALHIQRENYLEALVSERIAEITQTWSASKRKDSSPKQTGPRQIELDVEECRRHFQAIDSQRATFARQFDQTMDVIYEDLLNNYEGVLRNAQDFLQIAPKPVTSPLRKQAKKAMWDMVTNFDELARAFEDTPWQHFFDSSDALHAPSSKSN